jgi:hypothetical protein
MRTKDSYAIGDTVWIYGISMIENKLTQGIVVKTFTIDNFNDTFYVISVPSSLEPLLLIRTWEAISQDSHGPVGGLREAFTNTQSDATHVKMSEFGYLYDMPSTIDGDDDPSPEEINAAIERINESSRHTILRPKPARQPRTRHYNRKKKL